MSKRRKFGYAFAEELAKVSFKFKHFKNRADSISWKDQLIFGYSNDDYVTGSGGVAKYFFVFVVIIAFLGLFLRLFHLQIVNGDENRVLADSNRIQIKVIHAPRGVIYDRNGKILAQNEPGFRLVGKAASVQYFTRDEFLKMESQNDPRLVNLEIDSLRSYPRANIASHVVGYVGEITEEEIKDPKYKDYRIGDRIGKAGVEQIYENVLRGIDGGQIIEVDAQGSALRVLRETQPTPGQNLFLSVDSELQDYAYKTLVAAIKKVKSCCGAAIVQEVQNGEILSLISLPSFNPEDISSSLEDTNSPFLNRAISGTYPPGSIFKIASALAGLTSGKITSKTQFEDTGVVSLGEFTFANWYFSQYGRKEGLVDMVKALKRSNDTFFYRLGQAVGEVQLGKAAKKFGLGQKTKIDLPGEATGLIPDNEWKIKNVGTVWYPGDTMHMAIGQGFVLLTPIQVSNLIAIIAQDGKLTQPHLASKITSSGGSTIKEFEVKEKELSDIKSGQLNLIKQGLAQVTQSGGTAWPFFTFPIKTAGKTGTAEFGDPKDRTHAWYTAYAPVVDPEIVVTVLVEAGGEGSSVATPVAKEIMRWYFSHDKVNLIKDIYPIATESAKTLGE